MAAGQLKRRFPPRLFSASLGVLLVCAALVGSLLYLTGAATGRVFLHLGLASACILLATLAWEVVVRQAVLRDPASGGGDGLPGDPSEASGAPRADSPGTLPWLAFPVAVMLGLASLPFLTLVVYPPVEEYFTESGRVSASVSRESTGLVLNIDFPEPTTEQGDNLRINGKPLPEGYAREHPEVFVWRGSRTLTLSVEPLLADLGLESIERVGINQLSAVPRFTYLTGKTVPQQRVVVRQAP